MINLVKLPWQKTTPPYRVENGKVVATGNPVRPEPGASDTAAGEGSDPDAEPEQPEEPVGRQG